MRTLVGVDLVAIGEVQASLEAHGERYARRLFTAGERAYCARQRHAAAASYAARFAAKEATIKLLRPGAHDDGVPWADIEVVRAADGACDLTLTGAAQTLARRRGLAGFSVSLSHEAGMAIAVVIAERRTARPRDEKKSAARRGTSR